MKNNEAYLNELYDIILEAQTILIENKDYFSEEDFNKYNDRFNEKLEDISGALLELHESSKGTR